MATRPDKWAYRIFVRLHKRWQRRSAARELAGLRRRMALARANAAAEEDALRTRLPLAIAALAIASALVIVTPAAVEAADAGGAATEPLP